jgi:hypothetical protein
MRMFCCGFVWKIAVEKDLFIDRNFYGRNPVKGYRSRGNGGIRARQTAGIQCLIRPERVLHRAEFPGFHEQ